MLRFRHFESWLRFGALLAFVSTVDSASGQISKDYLARVPAPVSSIQGEIDESRTTLLRGNTHPLALAADDRGPVAQDQQLRQMLLLLRRSPSQEAALEQLL